MNWIYGFMIIVLIFFAIIITPLAISVYRKKQKSKKGGDGKEDEKGKEVVKTASSVFLKNITLFLLALLILVWTLNTVVHLWIYVVSPEHRGHSSPTAHEPIPYRRQGVREIKITRQEIMLPRASADKEPTFELTSASDVVIIRGEKKLPDGSIERTQAVRFSGRGSKEDLPKADDYFIRLESGNESTILWWEK